jgi:long-chain-fatty-acid--[acyl-carrier-protein] ligase
MLNWTLPVDAFNHCVNFSKTTKILTSSNFYDKVKNKSLDEHREKYIYLENLLRDIKTTQKLKALVKSFFMSVPDLPNTAVILFTSGSESLPKAVALTHENLIENII